MALGPGKSQAAERSRELVRTSSLHRYALCDLCGKREPRKQDLAAHLAVCVESRTCTWCNIVFKNRGNLFSHSLHLHGKKSRQPEYLKGNVKVAPSKYRCAACPKAYTQVTNLKYHIRREHYNMLARMLEADSRRINEVWLERVLNSDMLVEITKAKRNMYLMRRVSQTTSLKISEPRDSIDLSPLYPTHARIHRVWCDLCKKTYYQRDFRKHNLEKHEKVRQHECNNCGRSFQRHYQYLQHVCSRMPRWRRAALPAGPSPAGPSPAAPRGSLD